jgi:hypothetical protein
MKLPDAGYSTVNFSVGSSLLQEVIAIATAAVSNNLVNFIDIVVFNY